MRLGYAAAKRGDHQAAVAYFRDALFHVPDDRYMRLGYDETHSRDYQSALINFRRGLEERPNDYFATQAVRNVRAYLQR